MRPSSDDAPGEAALLRAAFAADVSVDATDFTPTPANDLHVRIDGHFGTADEADDGEEPDSASREGDEAWAALPFLYTVGLLSFRDAGPRGASIDSFQNDDAWTTNDLVECLRYERGELHFYADYVRGRCMKTRVVVRPDGTFSIETTNRRDAALRWLERIQGTTATAPQEQAN
jgi:hypothetical protein